MRVLENQTLDSIGKTFNITRERVRQICAKPDFDKKKISSVTLSRVVNALKNIDKWGA